MSDTMAWFMAGMMALSRELAIFIAPNINSYKRYASLSWAPVNVVWGRDNRTTGFRVVGNGSNLHVENRFPGGDMNAYLTYAAMIGAGLWGIEQKLEPPAEFKGNGYIANGRAADAAGALRGDPGAGAVEGGRRDLRPGRRRPLPERRPGRTGSCTTRSSTTGIASVISSAADAARRRPASGSCPTPARVPFGNLRGPS